MSAGEWTRQTPKRFYKTVGVEPDGEGFRIQLDERPIRTPLKNLLSLPTRSLADAIAQEWSDQEEHIAPNTMPISKLAHTSIDHASAKAAAIVDEFVSYAGSDMVCYRADAPDALVERQGAHWDPVLEWAKRDLGAQFVLVEGVIHHEQPAEALQVMRRKAADCDPFRLTGVQTLTALTGSALLALALSDGVLEAEAAWLAAHVDEDFQIELWGRDEEAEARRASRRDEFDAAVRFLRLLDD